MSICEEPVVFTCKGDFLIGVFSVPALVSPVGVVIVVGGPQYRVGTHGRFVQLARALASGGVTVLRFDYRGMGDSAREMRGFEDIEADIRAAVDTLLAEVPEVERIHLFGLCDGASAAAMYAANDPRVVGLILANPWVRTDATEVKALVKHYYLGRLLARDFWIKVWRREFHLIESASQFLGSVKRLAAGPSTGSQGEKSLPDRMAAALGRFRGRILILLSGNDLTAAEFADVMCASATWRSAVQGAEIARFPESDHTFSRQDWSRRMEEHVSRWLGVSDNAALRDVSSEAHLVDGTPKTVVRAI
jgi:exosortase A-associated hydrolase 1